jgi:hypothetical protein
MAYNVYRKEQSLILNAFIVSLPFEESVVGSYATAFLTKHV